MAPNITEIGSTSEFDNIVKGLPSNQLLVIDFHAVWCGPCHAIAPVLEQLSNSYKHVKFVKIDVDKQAQLAQRFQVRAMPTFKFLKGGREVDELRGASPPQLNALVSKHAGNPESIKNASASSSSSSSTVKSSSNEIKEGSLLKQIVSNGLSCLNESSEHPLSSIIGPNPGPKGVSYLESDVDSELLISIPFQDQIKLKSISIFSIVSPSQAPKTIELYINQPNIDFQDTENLNPSQELELTQEQIKKGEKIDLRFVRFQNVRSLQILVKSNQEDEETTRIDSIDLFGTTGDASSEKPSPAQQGGGGSMLERLMGRG
ncbi:thioredoxin [Kwoniella dendrophila CBS 6074]|uniref:Thioredoxin n=1 Tax=Kwoniella dendrophila CBS 6074 TaxID=1295534 RepID=A0AAX4JQY9_9TREE